ncbi:uncharacterized protein LOC105210497 isoform X3 [Zeugodacus cucurbitae]|uniref:uncharacterized protein LOC105210497 isoform X3 n=1 Tax=Zeugodacus cucurbitae TaxID=28588 RepID=UPI0023D90E15|nr:uncharacterized protein LOC105210497 isoform X3 [Zeugodacus cucurbitae]
MSSYRSSYTPWKTSLGSSYKPSGSSAYSSRDDIGSSRYTSLTSPSTYRPSFSGGTYRVKRDPPSSLQTPSYTSRYTPSISSRTTPVVDSTADLNGTKSSQLKRYTTSTTGSLNKYGSSREPSPAALEITNRMRSREPSPVSRTLRGKSRDPSPVVDTSCKIGYGGLNSYRMSTPKSTSSSSYNSRYGSGTGGRASTVTPTMPPDKSISYLTASDFHARSVSRARETAARKSNEKEIEEEEQPAQPPTVVEKSESESSSEEEEEEEKFVAVSVVTRATSPTPPGSATTVQRTRRIDIAKTIEKTIQRSTRKRKTLEKEIQSDRLDDSTRYSRFGLSSRVPSYSPHTESRYSSTNLRYSTSPLSTVSKSSASNTASTTSAEKKDTTAATTSKGTRSNTSSKSKLSPPKVVRISSRQSSVENLTATTNANKPPAAPKAESPTKSSSGSTHAPTKLPNKDFRKSALNVGPTDRPRKSRTPSSGTDSDPVQQAHNDLANGLAQRKERSPSAGSEVSNVSAASSRRSSTTGESKTRPRCHAKKTSSSSLSRHNSNNNLKNSSHKSCTPSTSSTTSSSSTSSTTTASSSSGAESSSEQRKTNKKQGKKKNLNTHNKDHTANNSTVTKCATTSTGDSNDSSSKRKTNENSKAAQQPPALPSTNDTSAVAAAESSRTNSRSPLASSQEKTTNRLQKLSSVSNFFAARQSDANSEPIFIESSENSGGDSETGQLIGSSLTATTKSNTSPTNNATTTTTTTTDPARTEAVSARAIKVADLEPNSTKSKRNCDDTSLDSLEDKTTARSPQSLTKYSNATQDCSKSTTTKSSSTHFPHETTVTETAAITSEPVTDSYTTTATTSAEEQDESSWWQDTSRQIDTASALGYHQKDDMRFKLRHIDSGETAWWLRNDDDDTLADVDLKTLNQEEEDHSEATTAPTQSLTNNSDTQSYNEPHNSSSQAKYSWWTSDNNDEQEESCAAEAHNENDQNETNYSDDRTSAPYYKVNGESKQIARSHCTPEKPWWGDSNENSKADSNSNGRLEKSNSATKQNGTIQLKICRVESGERPWWLSEVDKEQKHVEEEPIVEATIKLPARKSQTVERSTSSGSANAGDDKRWWMSGPMKKQFTVRRVESGEKAWWQQNDEDEANNKETQRQQTNANLVRDKSNETLWWQNNDEQAEEAYAPVRARPYRSDSTEKAWWLQDDEEQVTHTPNGKVQNGDEAALGEDRVDRADTEVQRINNGQITGAQQQSFGTELSNSFNFEYSERPPPLGQCASPVDLEQEMPQQLPLKQTPTRNLNQCKSPYDNIPMSKVQVNHYYQPQYAQQPSNTTAAAAAAASQNPTQPPYYQQPPQQQQLQQQQTQQAADYYTPYGRSMYGEKLFISRHQNIDELLGGSCRPLSPIFLDGSNSFATVPANRNLFIEEITPDQVRIHDSTAQMPVIQRMERDEWDNYGNGSATQPPAVYERNVIDDAAIQVYKDGDYGAYLDLESSLAEQAEEIEGLNSSRKNSLVVRTQLSVRVHAIIEKLLSSEGSELRRALFSLKQVFQEDKDLVHAFVALGGLNCLVRVGNGADQNYQNYILRALGQVMLYVDGMNGVMKHEPTMQWLYSLIASNYRSVVKTALKLLLVFVEYAETNCYVLVNAIHAVDKTQGTLPWSNLMRLLKDYDNADAELVIYATSLINKTLAGLNDQDSFYDESDLLEQQGMESVIQRYMSKPGTDLDLLDQLQLYEAVLKFEDGEAEGIRLPENSLRKTQRHRQSTDTAERRKSRRHSTGTSPHVSKVIASPKRMTPTHGVLDEDSSGSTNSAEFTVNGVFNGDKARDGVGVTPGLRRRRERAERHKSFLKEQQEAVANGIFAALERREEIGQIVTAIPATVKMGDSPPESLTLTNEASINQNQNKNHNNNSNIHTTSIASSNITANATNNNINLINTNSNTNPGVITSTNNNNNNNNLCNINNNTNNSNSLLSPTRHLLGSNTISIINNNITANPLHSNNNNKLHGAPEFLTKKNLLMERNATVINGIMKNIQRVGGDQLDNNHNNNIAYKKFENDANRLNSYYNQLSTPKNQNQLQQQQQLCQQQQQAVTPTLQHQNSIQSPSIQTAHNVLAAVLSPKKSLNGFDFTQSTPKTPPNTYEYNLRHNTTPLTSPIHTLPEEPMTVEYSSHTPTNTPSTPTKTLSSLSTPTTPTTPQTPLSRDFTPVTPLSPLIAPHTNFNTRAAPPPPPPPPPPPDLLGHYFMMPTPPPPPPQYGLQSPADATLDMRPVDMDSLNSGDVLAITESDNEDRKLLQQLKRDHTVKDLTQKLSNMPMSPTHEEKLQNRIVGDMSGLISKAKEGLAKSKSKGEMSRSSSLDQDVKKVEPKKSENELHWEELVRNMVRPLNLCDLDFTDLNSEDEKDMLAPRGLGVGIPPPPPPFGGVIPPPMMPPAHIVCPPPNSLSSIAPPPLFSYSGYGSMTNSANSSMNGSMNGDMSNTNTIRKNKKTVKLFWKEVREDMIPVVIGKTIWDELPASNVDTQKLEHLFESRAKDLMTKKQQELNKSKEIIVLDHKRSNAINIAMTKLPPPRAIKAAILKMDATVVTREGIDKLLNMLPTDEERGKIQEAQMANPELPLGSAEQFLLTLASISELGARLKLWAFRLDFDNSEKEIAEPLMDLKQGIEILRNNRTFKCILSTLLSVGIFLNGAPVKGFQIEYLSKVPEVKDTVHKHSLLHHLCHMVMESSPDTTDLYSEIGPITRASKADFSDLAHNLSQLETECKASWDRLKLIAKHDCPPQLKQKLVDFLADCAERIIILQIVHRRVINRYRKFLLWLGAPQHTVSESKPNEFCRILSEFALEYRTTRERVQQQLEKKANHRERNKTRGKLIIDMAKFKTKEDRADAELKELLGTASADTPDANGTLTWRRRRAEQLRSPITRQSEENFTDGDDEILESLVKTATKAPGTRTTPRERKRTRHADRKSLKRSRTREGFTVERAPSP